jgi:type IV pilus assembly protein PilO
MAMKWQRINWQNPGEWPSAIRYILPILLFLVVLYIGYLLSVSSTRTQLNLAHAEENNLKAMLAQRIGKVANLTVYQQQLSDIQMILAQLSVQLPSTAGTTDVLQEIAQSASIQNITLSLIKPLPEVDRGFYNEIPLEITAVGTYQQLGEFVSRLSALNRIITIDNFIIEPVNSDVYNNSQPMLLMNLKAIAYRYDPQVPSYAVQK